MNILLTTIGRRGYLADFFRRVPGVTSIHSTTDRASIERGFSAGCLHCDHSHLVPSITDPDYVSAIVEVCRTYEIDLLLSLYDPDIRMLSQHRSRIEECGVMTLIPDSSTSEICFDKLATFGFLNDHGFPTPWTVNSKAFAWDSVESPVILKSRFGHSGQDLQLVHSQEAFELATSVAGEELIVQEYVQGAEYGLDLFNDQNGRGVACVIRQKITMRAGETDQAVTVKDDELMALGFAVSEVLGQVGPLDLDLILTDSGPKILDLNPRFGGGYPLAHAAGVDFPGWIVAIAGGEALEPRADSYQAGLVMIKELTPKIYSRNELTGRFESAILPPSEQSH